MQSSEKNKTVSKKRKTALKVLRICGLVFLFAVLGILLLNSLLCLFAPHYYPTWGNKRLFAIVSDSMEPTIMTGNMIVSEKPKSQSDIKVGDIVTYEYTQRDRSTTLITHRVVEIRYYESGEAYYVTKGDNVERADSVQPSYSDVVGVFTGKQCGVLGYVVGFLQSSEGAIALILAVMISLIAYIVVRFVNLVNTWRDIAVLALEKSGKLLKGTQNEDLVTISDVIGIITKDPSTKKEAKRKDKKLKWFVETGMLPKRPYSDDLDESLMALLGTRNSVSLSGYDGSQPSDSAVSAVSQSQNGEDFAAGYVTERSERVSYRYSNEARLIQLKPQTKEWYSAIKNCILQYQGIRVRSGKRFETFFSGRKAVARLLVRGKTLCLLLALDPDIINGTKYAVERCSNEGTPCLYRIKSAKRLRYACELTDKLMAELNVKKASDYVARDYYMPYEGIVSLMSKNLVRRKIGSSSKTYRIEEVDDADLMGSDSNGETAKPEALDGNAPNTKEEQS